MFNKQTIELTSDVRDFIREQIREAIQSALTYKVRVYYDSSRYDSIFNTSSRDTDYSDLNNMIYEELKHEARKLIRDKVQSEIDLAKHEFESHFSKEQFLDDIVSRIKRKQI